MHCVDRRRVQWGTGEVGLAGDPATQASEGSICHSTNKGIWDFLFGIWDQ